VERALTLVVTGTLTIATAKAKTITFPRNFNFGNKTWAAASRGYAARACKLSEARIAVIVVAAREYVVTTRAHDATDATELINDPSLLDSDEECTLSSSFSLP
jgi:hypothetical protein